ncbi:MAG: hypothetical protein V1703_03405 [Candidatus Altiarchaeota archaeon]
MPYAIPAGVRLRYDEKLFGPITLRQAIIIALIGGVTYSVYDNFKPQEVVFTENYLTLGIVLAVFFVILSVIFGLGFEVTYLVLVKRNDSIFEGDVKNHLAVMGLKGRIVRLEGVKAKSCINAFHSSSTAKREVKIIGHENTLEWGGSVLYVVRVYGKERPKEGLDGLENKLSEHSI